MNICILTNSKVLNLNMTIDFCGSDLEVLKSGVFCLHETYGQIQGM